MFENNDREGRYEPSKRMELEVLIWLCLTDPEGRQTRQNRPMQVIACNAENRREMALWN